MKSKSKKTLDLVVKDALELHGSYELPRLDLGSAKRRLVIASGNALPTGRIIFADEDAVFANESQYKSCLSKISDIDSVVIISASGEKHAPLIIGDLLNRGDRSFTPYLLTCNAHSSAASMLDDDFVFVTRKNEEPLTYNTSTYLGMIFAKTRENPLNILQFIDEKIDKAIDRMEPKLSSYDSFFILVGENFDYQREMFVTKFDELFGPKLNGRCFTFPQAMHARTVVQSKTELFIGLEVENSVFGYKESRLNLPKFDDVGQAAVVAIGYYVIGKIQSQSEPWFLESVDDYTNRQSELFKKLRNDDFQGGV